MKKFSNYIENQLKAAGVTYNETAPGTIQLKCSCGQIWQPLVQTGGRFANGFWKCPQGCSDKKS